MRIQCPHCQGKFKCPDSIVGKKVKCPKCEELFACAEFVETTVPLSTPRVQKCGNCGRKIGALEESFLHEGHVFCKACDALLEGKSQAEEQVKNYGGIRRTGFIWGTIASNIIYFSYVIIASEFPNAKPYKPIIGLISFFVLIYLIANRLENIGWSGWCWPLIFVPIVNFFIVFACYACPEGYQDTKKLDTDGKIIAGVLFFLIAFIFVIVITTISAYIKTH